MEGKWVRTQTWPEKRRCSATWAGTAVSERSYQVGAPQGATPPQPDPSFCHSGWGIRSVCLWMGCARTVRVPQWAAGPVHRLTSCVHRWCSRPPVRGREHGRAGQGRLRRQKSRSRCRQPAQPPNTAMAEGGKMAETGATANAEPRHCWDGTFLILLGRSDSGWVSDEAVGAVPNAQVGHWGWAS